MFFPFLGFGVFLIILTAASTESAPRQFYPGIEEDDEIDRLAQLELAGVHINPDDLAVDLELPEYFGGGRVGDGGGRFLDEYPHEKDFVNNLTPKQPGVKGHRPFGYTADKPEFHLPREALVASTNRERNEIQEPLEELGRHEAPPPPYMKKSSKNSELNAVRGGGARYSPTNDQDLDSGGGASTVAEHVAPPNHVMTSSHHSDHSANPYYTATTVKDSSYSTLYMVMVAAGSAMGVVILVGAGICWYRINERIKATADVDYPAYGVTGPSKDVSPTGGDRKLAQSAHMYHYQHQKQQMAALQKSPLAADGQGSAGSDLESDDENEEGDYTVYECPGLAPAGDMEVKNPLYQDEPTPATPQTVKCEDGGSATTTTEGGSGSSGGGGGGAK